MTRILFYFKRLPWLGLLALVAAACQRGSPSLPASPSVLAATTSSPASSSTLPAPTVEPSFTPLPLAARVNGEEITQAEYQAELALYHSASGTDLAPEDEQKVLDDLVDEALLARAATENGFEIDDAMIDSRIQELAAQLGGEGALSDWMTKYDFTPQSFRLELERSIRAAWMRDHIIDGVPKEAEQIHARQILLYNADQANEVMAELEAGNDFGNLALKYDPLTGGDLDWFPRGYLPAENLEAAAFNLEPGQYTPVIETPAGFHILQVLERDPNRPLTPDALRALQIKALQEWLEMERAESEIQVLLP
jgi:peptidyl-prolyl cis-trans isomerase C